MIYSSFKDVERDLGYVQQYVSSAKDRMVSYIKDIIDEVYTVNLTIGGAPVMIIRKKDGVYIVRSLGMKGMSPIDDVSYETLLDICMQLHDLHLVKEWGEDEDPETKEE
jgi:hypothetical protein